jgi:hypothetical protein
MIMSVSIMPEMVATVDNVVVDIHVVVDGMVTVILPSLTDIRPAFCSAMCVKVCGNLMNRILRSNHSMTTTALSMEGDTDNSCRDPKSRKSAFFKRCSKITNILGLMSWMLVVSTTCMGPDLNGQPGSQHASKVSPQLYTTVVMISQFLMAI